MSNYAPVDLKALEKRVCSPSKDFLAEGQLHQAHRLLIHKDRGAKVLGVAHLDFVGDKKPHMAHCATKSGKRFVWSDRLDDRLGAYILLDYLPSLGVEMDVLLTDDEESGKSTASEFVSPKEYNWIVMFDRRGTELVMYQYETKDLCTLVEGFGFKVGVGSFSCIGKMESLGVSGFNIGTGYYMEHTKRSYAILNEVEEQANKFAAMYHQYKDTKLVHDKSKASRRTRYTTYYNSEDWGGNHQKKANPYGSIDTGDFKILDEDDKWLTPAEIAEWNKERDGYIGFNDMTDEEWAEFCGKDIEMRAADAAYYRMRNAY